MVAMVLSPVVSGPRPPRPRWRSPGRRRSTTHPLAGRSAAEDDGRAAILFRDAKALAPAENSRPAAIAAEAIEASAVLRPDQAIKRRRGRVLTIGEGPGDPVGLPHLFDMQTARGQGL